MPERPLTVPESVTAPIREYAAKVKEEGDSARAQHIERICDELEGPRISRTLLVGERLIIDRGDRWRLSLRRDGTSYVDEGDTLDEALYWLTFALRRGEPNA